MRAARSANGVENWEWLWGKRDGAQGLFRTGAI